MIELLQMLLATSNAEIISTTQSLDAVHLVEVEAPDLILMDMMMPEMDGKQTCQAIRTISDVPVVIISAMDTPSLVAEVLNAGADDYLIKPVSSGILTARINKLMRRVRANAEINNISVEMNL
jgi:DNA-binding response OmpR family regulator